MSETLETYLCNHCGHRFEAPARETIVCPKCFWSTSVQKERSEMTRETPSVKAKEPAPAPKISPDPPKVWLIAGSIFVIFILAGIFFFAARHLKKQDEAIRSIEYKDAQVIAEEAPELTLTPEEKETLERQIPIEMVLPSLTEAERETLARKITLGVRSLQGLATPPWDEKQFDAFLESQEIQYKIPLEWSYRRKLKSLFRNHYLPAAAAFETKNYLTARNGWIRSLAFPVYRNNIQKHRGVVLTLLRPFVNDTLSKIGAMNALLTDANLFQNEETIHSNYEALHELLAKESWEEAGAKLLELEKNLVQSMKPAPVHPPDLPAEAAQIDADIHDVLLAQASPRELGERDWENLRADLEAKEKVVQSRLTGSLEEVKKQYDQALSFLKNGNWREAREILRRIEFPETLVEDAQSKIQILDQLIETKESAKAEGSAT